MKHKHHWLCFWYHENCAPCRVRKFLYGYRLDPVGYMEERSRIPDMKQFTVRERLWILDRVRPIEIELQ